MRRFDHIDLRVRDKAEARQFYEKVLPAIGFPFIDDSGEWLCFGSRPHPEIGDYAAIKEDPAHIASQVCASRSSPPEQLMWLNQHVPVELAGWRADLPPGGWTCNLP
jgi:catechol 2,3-dioxygenase-like lactoylglutathione lyase family enzyme